MTSVSVSVAPVHLKIHEEMHLLKKENPQDKRTMLQC